MTRLDYLTSQIQRLTALNRHLTGIISYNDPHVPDLMSLRSLYDFTLYLLYPEVIDERVGRFAFAPSFTEPVLKWYDLYNSGKKHFVPDLDRVVEDKRHFDFAVITGSHPKVVNSIWGRIRVGGFMVGEISRNCFGSNTVLPDINSWILHKTKWIMISGCYRGGTKYIQHVMRALNLGLGHQKCGKGGIVSGMVVALNHPEGTMAIHQLRHPLKVIESLQIPIESVANGLRYFFLEQTDKDSNLLLAMKYWLWVDRLAKERGLWWYRVEDIVDAWPEICHRIAVDAPLPSISKQTNERRYKVKILTWDDLKREDRILADEIIEATKEYGYDV